VEKMGVLKIVFTLKWVAEHLCFVRGGRSLVVLSSIRFGNKKGLHHLSLKGKIRLLKKGVFLQSTISVLSMPSREEEQ